MTTAGCTPSESFWKGFVDSFWEKQPTTFSYPAAQPLMTEAEALRIYLALAVKLRRGQGADIAFYIESGMLSTDIGQYLPIAADRSLEEYRQRVLKRTAGRPFALITNAVRAESPAHRQRLRAFTRGLLALVGKNVGRVGADIFLSNTPKTAFGVHRDSASNFSYIVSGKKRMLVWPREVFANRADQRCDGPNSNIFLDGIDYDAYRDRATVLEGSAGEMLYWPSSYWHVAESSAEPSLVFNVPIYLHAAMYRMAIEYYQRKLNLLEDPG